MMKNKWSNLSRKGMDQTGQPERKSGLNTILAKEKGKVGIMGLIAAMKEKEDNPNVQTELDRVPSSGLKRMNKLPSLTPQIR